MDKTSTLAVINSAPTQASCFQSSYGLIANWKITTGRFAIGAFIDRVKWRTAGGMRLKNMTIEALAEYFRVIEQGAGHQ